MGNASHNSRPALGQLASLGSLYDARTDSFLAFSLFHKELPASCIKKSEMHSTTIKFAQTDTYQEKFNLLHIPGNLQASFLAGLIEVGGSGLYLKERRQTNQVAQCTLNYSTTTVQEVIKLSSPEIGSCLNSTIFERGLATHVVTGIEWGANCIVTATSEVTQQQDKSNISGQLQARMDSIVVGKFGGDGSVSGTKESLCQDSGSSSRITIHGDVVADDGLMPTDFESAKAFMSNIPSYIQKANDGKGKPIAYTLVPLNVLKTFYYPEIRADVIFRQMEIHYVEQFVHLFDDIRCTQQMLNDYEALVHSHQSVVSPVHVAEIKDFIRKARFTEQHLTSKYMKFLREFRSADEDSTFESPDVLLNEFRTGENSPEQLSSIIRFKEQIAFADLVKNEGAEYVGYQGGSVLSALSSSAHYDTYVLYYTEQLRRNSLLWAPVFLCLLDITRDQSSDKTVLVVDCEAVGMEIARPLISQYHGTQKSLDDVVEYRRILSSECLIRCDRTAISTTNGKPLQRRVVKVPCPHRPCSRTLRCEWVCETCHCAVEFGVIDDLLYCNCGACPYDKWEFKCKDHAHGPNWSTYDQKQFLSLLRALESFDELNILILGETGVGKSTWINAFVNYLTHSSLTEAMEADSLRWVVPCSFSTQIIDTEDKKQELVQKKIKVGSSPTERDEPGRSATRQTSVYLATIDSTRVRLIDTPGIGDTEGLHEDKKNMSDILRVLRSYSKLHGILILLKPNASRLTLTFQFCLKELLSHIHRDAVNNIIFGFTNTRASGYKHGDTLTPLRCLLDEQQNVTMGLYNSNTYCFDSESFRYLAAFKQGVDMGFFEENKRSWEHSVKTCHAMISHLETLEPHNVRSTLSLNETKTILTNLIEPMTLIREKIKSSIEINKNAVEELQQRQHTKLELEARRYIMKNTIVSSPVDQSHTVCTNAECIKVHKDSYSEEPQTIYTTCHKPCRLGFLPEKTKGSLMLKWCSTFTSNGDCRNCAHNFADHMHVYYEYKSKTVKLPNEAINSDLLKNAEEIELQTELIETKAKAIREFQFEYTKMQEAAVEFGYFLKQNAITPYNDSLLEYLDHLIEREKSLVEAGGRDEKLKWFKKEKDNHKEKVEIYEKEMSARESYCALDQDGVRERIESLYSLPHFGADLQMVMDANEKAGDLVFREKSVNIWAGDHWEQQRLGLGRRILEKVQRALERAPWGHAG